MEVVTTGNLKKAPSQGNRIFILINILKQMEKYYTIMNI